MLPFLDFEYSLLPTDFLLQYLHFLFCDNHIAIFLLSLVNIGTSHFEISNLYIHKIVFYIIVTCLLYITYMLYIIVHKIILSYAFN